jgi:hypothetical protein
MDEFVEYEGQGTEAEAGKHWLKRETEGQTEREK